MGHVAKVRLQRCCADSYSRTDTEKMDAPSGSAWKPGNRPPDVEHGLAVLLHVADQEAFVEELYPMSHVHDVRIHDGLAKPGSRREIVVGYLVVVERAAEL